MTDAGEKVVFWTGVLALGRIDRLSAQLISDLEADTAEMAIGAIGQTPGAAKALRWLQLPKVNADN